MPKFTKGTPKPPNSGRKKGVGNKKPSKVKVNLLADKAYQALQQGLKQAGFDLVHELHNLYQGTDDDKVKLSILQMLLDRSIPALRPIEYEPPKIDDTDTLDTEDEASLIAKLEESGKN